MAKLTISPEPSPFATVSTRHRRAAFTDGRLLDVAVQLEQFDLSRATPEQLVEACSDQSAIKAAMQARSLIPGDEREIVPEVAVYVMGTPSGTASKIGVSCNPKARLASIQSGNPVKMTVHSLFWIGGNAPAYGVEALALKVAAASGNEVRSEWVLAHPSIAAFIVASVIHTLKPEICDSGMWLRQREQLRRAMLDVVELEEEPS